MKLNLDHLLESARRVTLLNASSTMEVIVLNDVVDAETGEPIEISTAPLRGMNLVEAANFLFHHFAGDTAFVIRTPRSFAIVRPAFSELPIYYREREGRIDLWSNREVPAALLQSPLEFDLEYLSIAMHNWSWVTPRTGFQSVSELLSGAILIFDERELSQRDLLVDSLLKLPMNQVHSYEQQVNTIRSLILNSVRHKIGPYLDQGCIQCSGGLDSSIGAVAAAKLYPERKLPLIHCYSELDPHGDERFYFNAVASHIGWPPSAVDMYQEASQTDLSPHLLVPTVRPLKSSAALSTMATLKGLAMKKGARLMLSGDGGDQLFILNDPMVYCREVLKEATRPDIMLRTMSELASMGRETVWQVAGEALHGSRAAQLRDRFFGEKRFPNNPLAARAVPVGTEVVPNGLALAQLGVSRAFQYFGMRNAELNHIPVKGYPVEERKTFVFWPLIKKAITAQRSQHLKDGRDRAIERDAFRVELPGEVFSRFSKGGSRDFAERYDFDSLITSLQKGPLVRYGLVSEEIKNISGSRVDSDIAHALVVAQGVADWMELYA
ncbi:hypothetical protein N185_15650 [Sinorhizobium sp. GW3]|nr:hypothetical protein N185_15650 [Sinorhizobium sp. GW3]